MPFTQITIFSFRGWILKMYIYYLKIINLTLSNNIFFFIKPLFYAHFIDGNDLFGYMTGRLGRKAGAPRNSVACTRPLPEARVRVRQAGGGRDVPHAASGARRARAARRAPPLEAAARVAAR